MNIFYTNKCPIQSAREHCKVHTRKMIIEYAQLLSSAHHVLDKDPIEGIYKLTHKNHPSAIWVRSNKKHYEWVHTCAMELCRIYLQSTNKIHKTTIKLSNLEVLPRGITNMDFVDPPVAAPDKFKGIKIFEGTCKAYQEYIKYKFKEWSSREKPIKVEFYVDPPSWLD